MADDKAKAKALIDKFDGYFSSLDVNGLCNELSQIVMQWTYTVYEVFEVMSERRYSQAALEQVATGLINRINPANLTELAKTQHGTILLGRIKYLMNCEANPNQQVCQHVAMGFKRANDIERKKQERERNNTAQPRKLSKEEIEYYKGRAKRGEKFDEEIVWELPDGGTGFVTYNRNDVKVDGLDQIGTKETVEAIIRLARDWAVSPDNKVGRKLQIGDISRPGGLDTSQHKGHEDGKIFDIRPLRNDSATGKGANLNYKSSSYDQNLTKKFVKMVKKLYPSIFIRFNDGEIAGKGEFTYVHKDTRGTVHDDHLHLEFR